MAYETELRGVRAELAQSGEWWRGRVDAVRDEEEQHTEEVEEHVESLSQMLVQAEKQVEYKGRRCCRCVLCAWVWGLVCRGLLSRSFSLSCARTPLPMYAFVFLNLSSFLKPLFVSGLLAQLTLTKSALEESTAAREQLKATVGSLERHNEDLARQLEGRSGEIKRLRGEGDDAKRTAGVFEDELRRVATKLSEVDSEKGSLAKRIESYHTQEDNYRRHASELVDFSARAGAALAQAVKDALHSVELLNKVIWCAG